MTHTVADVQIFFGETSEGLTNQYIEPTSQLMGTSAYLKLCNLNPSSGLSSSYFPSSLNNISQFSACFHPRGCSPHIKAHPKARSCAGIEGECDISFKLKVFLPTSQFIPNNQNGLIPTLIGIAIP